MITAALSVFIVGLRHGADPDHLAAIDNLTRNASERMPRASHFVGSLFAVGHSAMVVIGAVLAALLGARLGHVSAGFERAGALASIVVLVLMAIFNIVALLRGKNPGLRARLLPAVLRDATHPLVAIPLGALFGLGFETSSQLITYGAAFSSGQLFHGLGIGAAFCSGMICTDTVDSVLVARMMRTRTDRSRTRNLWIGAVTVVALGVAVEESIEFLGMHPIFDEITLSAITVAFLLVTAVCIVLGRAVQHVKVGER